MSLELNATLGERGLDLSMRVGVGEIRRLGVMMSGADVARGEMVSEAVAIDGANDEQVPNLASIARVRER